MSQRLESNFLNSIRSETTKKCYQFYFNKYREFAKGNVLDDDRVIIENQIVDFLLSLKKRGLASRSVKCYFVAIAHYYIMNDILLNKKKIIKFIDTDEKKKSKNAAYTSEQIQRLLDVCDERTKAIVLIYASTGMRLAALPSLKLQDLKEYDDPARIGHITVYSGYKEEYTTFCTPECLKVIDSYLSYRRRCGEELQDDAPLIREQFNTSDSFRINHPKHVSLKTISKILRQKSIQAGLITNDHHVGKRKDIPLIHGFRKFFNTALMNADVHPSFKELLMGHSVKLDDVYYDKNSQKSQAKLLEEYTKAIDYLTINEENRLRIKVEQLTVEKSQIDQLQMQIDRLNQLIK